MKVEETLSSRNMKEEEEEEEIEETLSLCDLPLYSDQSADWDHFSSLNSNSTSSSSTHQDFFDFEFFTQHLRPSAAAAFPPENIIFCGKLIPYKHLSPCKTTEHPSNQAETEKSSRWRWRLIPTKNSKRRSPVSAPSKNGSRGTTMLMHQPQQRRMYNTTKQLGKAKWYFLLFGVSRLSPVVELSDIRNRQSRRRRHRSQSPPSSPPRQPSVMFGFRNDHKASHDRGGWGLWGLIRALSCGGNNYPTAVAAAGGAPPE